jgi:phosphoenolpyruvate carboxykinase (ATP)
MVVNTGKHTARAAQDKFIVREPDSEEHVWWGEYNRPISAEKFAETFSRVQGYLQGRDLFVQDCYGGADPEYQLPVRILTEYAWHSLFAHTMFINPKNREAYRNHVPEFTVLVVPEFKAFEPIDGTRTPTFITLNFAQKLAIIGNRGMGARSRKRSSPSSTICCRWKAC